jgi:hypothetical protein
MPAVIVVPTFWPMINAAACTSEIVPVSTPAKVVAIAALEDCRTTVIIIPSTIKRSLPAVLAPGTEAGSIRVEHQAEARERRTGGRQSVAGEHPRQGADADEAATPPFRR